MRRGGRAGLGPFACALLLAVIWLCAPARAAEPPLGVCGGDGPPALDVMLVALQHENDDVASREPTGAALRRAICDWFAGETARVSFARVDALPEPDSARLRVLVTLPTPRLARLYADGPRGRWLHDVALDTGLDDAGIESLAEAVHSTAQALTAPPPAEPPRPAPTAPPSPSPSSSSSPPVPNRDEPAPLLPDRAIPSGERAAAPPPRADGRHLPVHTALGYQLYGRGDEPPMHGPALHIELDAIDRGLTFGAFFRASLFTSSARRTFGFDVRTSGTSLAVGVAASGPVLGLTARAALAGGLDLIALAVRVTDPERVRLAPAEDAAPRPFVAGEAGLRYHLGRFEVGADALLRLLVRDTRYEVSTPDGPVTLLRPWQLQPGGLLAVGYIW